MNGILQRCSVSAITGRVRPAHRVAALTDYQPDAVLIEVLRMRIPCARWVLADGMMPPLALLGHRLIVRGSSALRGLPEWQAMIYALQRGIDVAFCDLSRGRDARPLAAPPASR